MAEKVIGSVNDVAVKILKETKLDFPQQRLVIADRLFNLLPTRMENLHLEDWYKVFWNIVSLSRHATKLSDQDKTACKNVLVAAAQEKNPVRRQFLAMILLMFRQNTEASKLLDGKYLSPQLREDFAVYSRWNNLLNNDLDLEAKANIRRNFDIAEFFRYKYADLIKKHAQTVVNDETCPKVKPQDYQIYFCWFQGEENFPPIVRCCYNSLKMNAGKYPIRLITEENFSDYVDIPDYILQKLKDGKITRTHFSDIIRFNLLEKYGGLWLDSCMLVTEPLERYKNLLDLPFFSQRFFKNKTNNSPYKTNISYGTWAGFAQGTSIKHNPLHAFVKEFYNEYWHENDVVIDYFIMDFVINMAYEGIPFVHEEIDALPINNPQIHEMAKFLNADTKKIPYEKFIADTFLHKLSWKLRLNMAADNTVFREIQRRYAPETIK